MAGPHKDRIYNIYSDIYNIWVTVRYKEIASRSAKSTAKKKYRIGHEKRKNIIDKVAKVN